MKQQNLDINKYNTKDIINLREMIKKIDIDIIDLIFKRLEVSKIILKYKQKNNLKIIDTKQEKIVIKRAIDYSKSKNIDVIHIKKIFNNLIKLSIKIQKKEYNKYYCGKLK